VNIGRTLMGDTACSRSAARWVSQLG